MRDLASDVSNAIEGTIQSWSATAITVVVTIVVVGLARLLLSRLSRSDRFLTLHAVAPGVANLLYIVGLRIALDQAPIHPRIAAWIDSGIFVLGVALFLWLLRRSALIGIEWSARRSETSPAFHQGFIPLLRNLITLFVLLAGSIMVLRHFNYDVMSLITALGVGSLAVGLAAKDTLSNMISGFTLIIDRNLSPGDRINLGGSVGEVEAIGLRSTRILTGNGNTLIVPNAELVNTKLLNLSQPGTAGSCSVQFRVPYGVSFAAVKSIALEVVARVPGLLRSPEPGVTLAQLAENGQVIQVGFWIANVALEGSAVSQFNEQLVARLAAAEIPISGAAAPTPPLVPRA